VLLSAGGNDAEFSNVVQECATTPECDDNESTYQGYVNIAENSVSSLITAIHLKATNAKIVLVGYPHLFTDTGDFCESVFAPQEVSMLNRLSDYLNTKAAATAAAPGAGYIDTRAVIAPGVCGTAAHLNGISFGSTGPGDFTTDTADPSDNQSCPLHWAVTGSVACLSRSSFHPNPAGAADYTARVTSQLPVVGYP
jgi:hypothetical protein